MECSDCGCTLQTRIEESWGRCDSCHWEIMRSLDRSSYDGWILDLVPFGLMAMVVIVILIMALTGGR